MALYTVKWIIEVDALSARHAAQLALEIQRDRESLATVFTVEQSDVEPIAIDLSGDVNHA